MKNRNGLTLIEVVISIALMGIVAIVFLSIFNTSNKNIVASDNRTQKTYDYQKEIDEKIEEHKNKGVEEITVTIFLDKSNSIKRNIKGSTITVLPKNEETENIDIITFIPNEIGVK